MQSKTEYNRYLDNSRNGIPNLPIYLIKLYIKEDGSYELLILANNDSLVKKFEGKYILDLETNKIKIEMETISFEHTIS